LKSLSAASRDCKPRSIWIAYLPCSRVPRRLQDIIDNARAIFGYTDGMDLTAFEENRRVYDAAERIRSFGNALRHEYDTIREDRLFEIVRIDLPGLCASAEEALRRWNCSNSSKGVQDS
jgi:uncharacterized protein with HEPN domain